MTCLLNTESNGITPALGRLVVRQGVDMSWHAACAHVNENMATGVERKMLQIVTVRVSSTSPLERPPRFPVRVREVLLDKKMGSVLAFEKSETPTLDEIRMQAAVERFELRARVQWN